MGKKHQAASHKLQGSGLDKRQDNTLVAMTMYASMGYEIRFRKFGYDKFQIIMLKSGEESSSSIIPEDHILKFTEVLIHLESRLRERKEKKHA